MLAIRLRVEMQDNESAQFASLFGRMREAPARGNKIDYFMMRQPKKYEEFVEDDDDGDSASDNFLQLNKAISMGGSRSAMTLAGDSGLAPADRKTSMRLRSSVKVNMRSSETALKLNKLMKIAQEKKSAGSAGKEEFKGLGGLDLEEQKS